MKGLILTNLLTYGGAVAALFNPFIGVCIYWLFDIVRPQYMYAWSGIEGSFSEIIAIATIIGWAFKGFGNWSFGRGRIVVVLYLFFIAWSLLSAVAAPNHEVALTFVRELSKRALMFVIAITLADSTARLKAMAWTIAGSAGYLALELNLRYLQGRNEAQMLGYGGMDNNSLAISMVTCFGATLFLGLYTKPLWQKGIAYGSAALIGHTVLMTYSRGGLLGLVLSGVAAFIIVPKRPRYLAVIALAVIVGLRFAGPELRDRFMSSFSGDDQRDASAQSRIVLWMDCLDVVERYPVLGAGPDHFPLLAAEFGWPAGKEAHSLWLQTAAEIGVLGAVALILTYIVAALKMWRFARMKATSDETAWAQTAACMVVTALAGFVISAQFVTIDGLETPLYVVVIAIGLLRPTALPAAVPSPAPVPATSRPVGFPVHRPVGAGLARQSALDRRTGA